MRWRAESQVTVPAALTVYDMSLTHQGLPYVFGHIPNIKPMVLELACLKSLSLEIYVLLRCFRKNYPSHLQGLTSEDGTGLCVRIRHWFVTKGVNVLSYPMLLHFRRNIHRLHPFVFFVRATCRWMSMEHWPSDTGRGKPKISHELKESNLDLRGEKQATNRLIQFVCNVGLNYV